VVSVYNLFETYAQPAESTLPCPPEWVNWLQESPIVPRSLIPYGNNDLFSDGTRSIYMRVFGPETGAFNLSAPFDADRTPDDVESHFRDDSCSTFAHDLLCIGNPDACKYWFMTAAEEWPEVTHHLRARDGTNTFQTRSISIQELSQVPFDVYFYVQKKGDLVILPPRR
jgi:hypothetical protein